MAPVPRVPSLIPDRWSRGDVGVVVPRQVPDVLRGVSFHPSHTHRDRGTYDQNSRLVSSVGTGEGNELLRGRRKVATTCDRDLRALGVELRLVRGVDGKELTRVSIQIIRWR